MDIRYTQTHGKYKQLSPEERGEAYLKLNCSISKIARMMNRSKSTISAEIKRGKYKGKYTASTAQNKSERRRSKSHKHAKWRNVNLLHYEQTDESLKLALFC